MKQIRKFAFTKPMRCSESKKKFIFHLLWLGDLAPKSVPSTSILLWTFIDVGVDLCERREGLKPLIPMFK
jgi:hypothetical protein